MNTLRITKVSLTILLLLLAFIAIAPTTMDINSMVGSKATAVILNRVRDLAAIPLSFGMTVLSFGSLFLDKTTKKTFSVSWRVRSIFLCCFILMVISGAYWTVGFTCMEVYPPMPLRVGLYLWEHSYLISLWWVLACVFLLGSLYDGSPKA